MQPKNIPSITLFSGKEEKILATLKQVSQTGAYKNEFFR
jgi:hypothetical protein